MPVKSFRGEVIDVAISIEKTLLTCYGAKGQGIDTDLTKDIKKEISDVKESLDKMTGPIKRNF